MQQPQRHVHGQDKQIAAWTREVFQEHLHKLSASLLFRGDLMAGADLPQVVLTIVWAGASQHHDTDSFKRVQLVDALACSQWLTGSATALELELELRPII